MSDVNKRGTRSFPAPFDMVDQIADYALGYRSIPAALQDEVVGRFGLRGLIET